jgi:uncharacterized protein YbjQ (UPF0145 family)
LQIWKAKDPQVFKINAKVDALFELCEFAIDKGGNGIIGIKFDISTLSNNILLVFVYGTIDELEK